MLCQSLEKKCCFLYYLYGISMEEYNQLFDANSKCEENETCK